MAGVQSFLIDFGQQRRYWVLLILLGVALEAGALYYQYAHDEWPCVLCIHVRMLVFAFILLGVVALPLAGSVAVIRLLHGLNSLVMAALVERSWQVLAVERGWVFGDCAMDLGMPDWFAIDKWLPQVFEVQAACGYSPLILFNISMAEALLVIAVLLLLTSTALFVTSWQK